MPDPPVASAYRQALLAARARSMRIQRQGLERLYSLLAESLARIAEDDARGAITAERASALSAQIEDMLAALSRGMAQNTGRTAEQTVSEVAQVHRQINRELFRRARGAEGFAALAGSFDRVPIQALRAMVARGSTAQTLQTLINRQIRQVAAEVDDFLGAAVSRGVSAGRASKDLARLMANAGGVTEVADQRAFARAFEAVGAGDIHRGAGTIDYAYLQEQYGLTDHDVKELRTLLYDARRIQVTETNNAFREANAESMTASPIVVAARWTLSGRHHVEDICDIIAETDAHGYGDGFYPPDHWPLSPHPHCLCSAGEVKYRRPSEWDQPKPASRPVTINPLDGRHTQKWAGTWTDNARDRYQKQYAAILQEAGRDRIRMVA